MAKGITYSPWCVEMATTDTTTHGAPFDPKDVIRIIRDALSSVLDVPPPPPPPSSLTTVEWHGGIWTLDADHRVRVNGQIPLGTGQGVEYRIVNDALYLKGLDSHWWKRYEPESSWTDCGLVQP